MRTDRLVVERLDQTYRRLPGAVGRLAFAYESPRFDYRDTLHFGADGLTEVYPGIGARVPVRRRHMLTTVHRRFQVTVNGVEQTVDAHPDTPLLTVLRNDLGLTGARFGCGQGLCGACFVRIDGTVVASCDTPIWSAAGRSVVTVEGLGDGAAPHPVQQALLDTQAAQCGYCVPGVLVSAAALLERDPRPDERAVTEALNRNLCRCGAQRRMVRAVLRAAGHGGEAS